MQIKIKTILNEINNQNLCLYRGKDYFYFTYSNIDEDFFETYSVYAYRLQDLGFGEWIEYGKDFCIFCEETIRHQNYYSY
jgi:hypothetical protein|tara:strand:- start:891 stop:1130 length:240 start_codon:yes stop_codon:yes gene_type:complete